MFVYLLLLLPVVAAVDALMPIGVEIGKMDTGRDFLDVSVASNPDIIILFSNLKMVDYLFK